MGGDMAEDVIKALDVVGDRLLTITPDEDVAVLIGNRTLTVDRSHRCAQLRAGGEYQFATETTDTKISYLARQPGREAWVLEKARQVREDIKPPPDEKPTEVSR